MNIEGADIPINPRFQHHPEMALGTWSREGRLYPGDYSLLSNGDLAEQLRAAIERRQGAPMPVAAPRSGRPLPSPLRPRLLWRISTRAASLSARTRPSCRSRAGKPSPSPMATPAEGQRHDDGPAPRRPHRAARPRPPCAAFAKRSWPDVHRQATRRALNRLYDRFVAPTAPSTRRPSRPPPTAT